MRPGARLYTDQEISVAIALRENGLSWAEIARKLNRHTDSLRDRVQAELRRRAAAGEMGGESARVHRPPNAALIEREKRWRAMDGMSLTASIFGDPPPGYSAWDRRKVTP